MAGAMISVAVSAGPFPPWANRSPQKSVEVGDQYYKLGKYRGAAYRYQDATLWNDGNAEAWLKLGKVDEKLKDAPAAKDAYTKYLALAPDAKEAPSIRKKLQGMK